MPEVQPYLAAQKIDTRPEYTEVGSRVFFNPTGYTAAVQGLDSFTTSMSRLAMVQRQEEIRVKREHDQVWAGENLEMERRGMLDWMSDPENANDPNIAGKFLEHANARMTQTSSSAPSPEAGQLLRDALNSSITRNYGEALRMGRESGLTQAALSFDNRANTALSAFRSGGSISDLTEAYKALYADIGSIVGKISPEAERKLLERHEVNLIYAAIDENPAFARELIDKSALIDERQRAMFNRTLDASIDSIDREARYLFDVTRDDARAMADAGTGFNEIPLDRYEKVYPKDVARAHKHADDTYIKTMAGVFGAYAKMQGNTPQHQVEQLSKMESGITTAADALKYRELAKMVQSSARLYDADKVAWMGANNEEIRRLTERIHATPEEERGPLMAQRSQALLRYQGHAPEGATAEERRMYMDMPENMQSLLTVDQAEEMAAKVNHGSPSQAMRQFEELTAGFTNEQHRIVAFNDMVRLPRGNRGVRQDLQLAIQNRGAWWLDSYLASITKAEGVKSISDVEFRAFEEKLMANGTWLAFQRSMIGDNLQRVDEIAGFKSGIINYARSQTLGGKSEKDAIAGAVSMLIGESLGFTDVNGRALVVPRIRKDLKAPMRTDDEILDVGRRLTMALSAVDPSKVDASILNLGELRKGTTEYNQAVRDQITSRGFYQPLPDGQGVSLYFSDDRDEVFQVRDRKGRPFTIYYDDLPMFMEPSTTGVVQDPFPSGSIRTRMVPSQPRKVYDLMEETGSDFWGTKQYRSHWPIQPTWLRNE